MKKSLRKPITAASYALFLLLASCGAQSTAKAPETVTEPAEESVTEESAKEETSETESDAPVKETDIDFPFSYDVEEGCKLTLACMDESAGVYELRFYNKDGNTTQKLPCGHLKEPVCFLYDNLTARDYYYNDLELFSDGTLNGLLIISDRKTLEAGKLFQEEPI